MTQFGMMMKVVREVCDGKLDKSGNPLQDHYLGVASLAAEMLRADATLAGRLRAQGFDADTAGASCVGHDLVEDRFVTFDRLRRNGLCELVIDTIDVWTIPAKWNGFPPVDKLYLQCNRILVADKRGNSFVREVGKPCDWAESAEPQRLDPKRLDLSFIGKVVNKWIFGCELLGTTLYGMPEGVVEHMRRERPEILEIASQYGFGGHIARELGGRGLPPPNALVRGYMDEAESSGGIERGARRLAA